MEQKIARARQLLATIRHAAMATVNADGTPHNTPYFFMRSPDLQYLFWGSHPDALHSQNIARTGQIFVVLYDSNEHGGGLFIRADNAHATEGGELKMALQAHNKCRTETGKESLPLGYYQGDSPQRMYMAITRQFWINQSQRDENGLIIRDNRFQITRGQLLP